jgi:hypothetical protein
VEPVEEAEEAQALVPVGAEVVPEQELGAEALEPAQVEAAQVRVQEVQEVSLPPQN